MLEGRRTACIRTKRFSYASTCFAMQNVKILGKIVKLKLQLGVLSLELASPQDALGYLEQALQVAKGELAIRTHDKNIESFVCSN